MFAVKVRLEIQDPAIRMTLAVMLKSAGYQISEEEADVTVADNAEKAIKVADSGPALVLATATGIGDAVEAMRCGVYGYIFVPLQPGEAALMVERAASAHLPRKEMPDRAMDLEAVERHHILRVLRECKGNHAKTAKTLRIGRNTLWRKLKRYRIGTGEESKGSIHQNT